MDYMTSDNANANTNMDGSANYQSVDPAGSYFNDLKGINKLISGHEMARSKCDTTSYR